MDSYLKYYNAKMRPNRNNSKVDYLSFTDKTPMEKVQLNFIKYTIGSKKTATNVEVRAELGLLPTESFIKQQTITCLSRLNNENLNIFEESSIFWK